MFYENMFFHLFLILLSINLFYERNQFLRVDFNQYPGDAGVDACFTVYTGVGITKDFHETRKGKIDDVKKIQKLEKTKQINEILTSDLILNDKIKELLRIKVAKYKMESLLKKEGATKSRVELMEHYVLSEEADKLAQTLEGKEKKSRERKK